MSPRPPRTVRRYEQGPLAFEVFATPAQRDTGRAPVVLVHGIGMSHRYFARLHDALSEDSAVYSIDLPGFARLPKPGFDVNVVAMARGLAEAIEALDVGPVILVGHSMGSQWVVEVAAERPDLVSHVVAMGPVTDDEHRSALAQALALGRDSLGEPPLVNAIVFTDYLRCGIPWYLAQVRHMVAYPIEDRVARLEVPLLIIRGEHDPIAGLQWCRRLRDRAPSAALVTIPGRYHVAQFSSPRAVADAISFHTAAAASPTGRE
jgi:pimeloyl-ACP methyl ester carboxylesterase